ncbi:MULTISPECIES: hypothetical protein [unclassified Azospirillum]|jgi:hypothetical protein|uniref:hypothetical protein n=1 Tax=unclassified Azospirillum TaxID=2630922 RepID=UPI000B629769|nr:MULTISPECIES: hypothetical protein [unclassified Azospirillum]SNS69007.1 hypothetical protein SAMN05880556_109133 [Azospirillum sp. RU38E]SNS87122.1 hypothetical protein SAMN05880591_109133 [Azospirillum sp. RU37A]
MLTIRETGPVWRLQAAPRELARAVAYCELPANSLVLTEAAWTGLVPDSAYVECPTFFLQDKVGFVALLAYFVVNGHGFRLFVRSPEGESEGLLLAYPRLDETTISLLRRFDRLAADQIDDLCRRLELFLGQLALPPGKPT